MTDQRDLLRHGSMNPTELRVTVSLAAVFAARLLGLFMVYPVFARLAQPLAGATPTTIGLALGMYGLAQGLLQVPLGLLSDRIGRKTVIVAGLAVFTAGSVVAALSTSILGVTAGRLIQGAGAVGSSILAWTGDLTREQVRTRAMAIIGVTIGLSFALALVVGPAIAAWQGLSGIFWVTAALGLGGIGITLTLVPTLARSAPIGQGSVLRSFGRVIRNPQLLRLDAGIFALHAILTATFLVVPRQIAATFHTSPGNEWTVYLPILLASIALMIPAVGAAEALGRIKEVSIGAILVLVGSLLALNAVITRTGCFIALSGFFAAFNVMEAILPSLVTKTAPANAKGAATGLYSSSQFLGIFAGGAGGGAILARWGAHGVWTFTGVLAIAWLLTALTMRRPVQRLP
jgi:predicted MFS family arabinose efflux permease